MHEDEKDVRFVDVFAASGTGSIGVVGKRKKGVRTRS